MSVLRDSTLSLHVLDPSKFLKPVPYFLTTQRLCTVSGSYELCMSYRRNDSLVGCEDCLHSKLTAMLTTFVCRVFTLLLKGKSRLPFRNFWLSRHCTHRYFLVIAIIICIAIVNVNKMIVNIIIVVVVVIDIVVVNVNDIVIVIAMVNVIGSCSGSGSGSVIVIVIVAVSSLALIRL